MISRGKSARITKKSVPRIKLPIDCTANTCCVVFSSFAPKYCEIRMQPAPVSPKNRHMNTVYGLFATLTPASDAAPSVPTMKLSIKLKMDATICCTITGSIKAAAYR